jgi:putative ABC transport system permease protein
MNRVKDAAVSRASSAAPIESLRQDVRHAVRTLRRSPGFTLVAVLILALGIGANTAIFSLTSAVLLRPLPFPDPDRLVVLSEDFTAVGGPARLSPGWSDFVEWNRRSRSVDSMAALADVSFNLTGDGEPEHVGTSLATPNLFSVLGTQPLLGRAFAPGDEGSRASAVVVISEGLWLRRFGGDPGVIGRPIVLDGSSHTVIGVVASDFRFPDDNVIWLPASEEELAAQGSVSVVARLAAGMTPAQAQAEMTTIAKALEQERGVSDSGIRITVAGLRGYLARDARPTVLMLLGAVALVLLITCANVANLLLARGATRAKELALRRALGAAHGRMVRQLLTESAVLAVGGVLVGIALAMSSFGYLTRLVPRDFPPGTSLDLDWRVLLFTVGLTLATVLLFGAGPALTAARLDLVDALKSAGRNVTPRRGRLRDALVVVEITLTVVLLAAGGLLFRSYSAVLSVDPGFAPQNLLIAQTFPSQTRYVDAAARSAFYRGVLERVRALPGVTAAGYVNYPPLMMQGGRFGFAIEGRPDPLPGDLLLYRASARAVSADYLSTLGVPLIGGRRFDERDSREAPRSVIINEAMARRHWPDRDPLGARLKLGDARSDSPWFTVVGVVGDIRQMGLDVPPEPEMYFSLEQPPYNWGFLWPRHLVVRTERDPLAFAAEVRSAIWEVDANQAISWIRPMTEVVDTELTTRNTQLTLIGAFAALALLLASIGLYGVLSYAVAQRTAEIGVRMALGAPRANVVRSVVLSALLLAVVGIGLGVAGALGVTRLLASFLFGVSPTDPATFSGVAAVVAIVSVCASYLPARRAASVDPVSVLRAE